MTYLSPAHRNPAQGMRRNRSPSLTIMSERAVAAAASSETVEAAANRAASWALARRRYARPMRCDAMTMRNVCPFTLVFFFRAEDGIRDGRVTGVQTCALPI